MTYGIDGQTPQMTLPGGGGSMYGGPSLFGALGQPMGYNQSQGGYSLTGGKVAPKFSNVGNDGGITGPDGNVIDAPPPAPIAPDAGQDSGSTSPFTPSPQGPFLERNFLQTYAGQPGPYASDGAQILDTRDIAHRGAGRFQNNAANRFSFQGGTQQWRPDANPYGQEIQPYTQAPQAPLTPPPMPQASPPGYAPPGYQPPGAPGPAMGGAPVAGGMDPAAEFARLMKADPMAAYQYTSGGRGPTSAMQWYQQNQPQIEKQYFGQPGAFNAWKDKGAYGGDITPAQMALLGIR